MAKNWKLKLFRNLIVIFLFINLTGCATSPRVEYLKPIDMPTRFDYKPKIYGVEKGSAAEKSGLKEGDTILSINEETVGNMVNFANILNKENEGIIRIERNDAQVELIYKLIPNEKFGVYMLPEREMVPYPSEKKGEFTWGAYERKNDIHVYSRIMGAKEYPYVVLLLLIDNQSQENFPFLPENILILDGNNTILNMYGGQILARNIKESAGKDFTNYSHESASYVDTIQSNQKPGYYKVSGSSQSIGSGSYYSYGTYGNFTYSGTSYSNYTVTPAPDFSGVGAVLGRLIGLAFAKSQLNQSLKVAEQARQTAFNFGDIPPGANRVGLIYFDNPKYLPLQTKFKINNNDEIYFKWGWKD